MISRYKLPLTFDPAPLRQDLEQIKKEDWQPHFNKGYFEGEWCGIALRSKSGDPRQLYTDPHTPGAAHDSEILSRCPNLRKLLATFACPIQSARLLKLTAGSYIKEHRDYDLSFADKQLRLHIPIVSDPQVQFFLDAEPVEMKEGECWYLDFNLPHWVRNNSLVDRVHLVIDCQLNDWLSEFFSGAEAQPAQQTAEPESSPEQFEQFRKFVLSEPLVQMRLRQTSDRESFVGLVTRVGHKHGFRFNSEDVEEAMQAARKARFREWMQ